MDIKKQGNKVVLSFDVLSEADAPLSKTEKSRVLFSTKGYTFDKDNIGISLNVIKPVKPRS